jgi:hypothetical protein
MGNSLSVLTSAISGAAGILLVSPQQTIGYQPTPAATAPASSPLQSAAPPPAFVFHYEGENTATLDSDITDHYVEDNTAIQDQIGLSPVMITTQGFIGELNNILDLPSGAAGQIVATAVSKLSPLAQYAPGLSVTAQNAYNEAFYAYQLAQSLANTAVSTWSSITGTGGESVIGPNGLALQPNQSKQQTAFQSFFGYWSTRTLFTVQTPWAVFENMAIKSLKAIQSHETRMITDFEITFKQMRFAQTLINTQFFPASEYGGRLAQQGASVTNLGTSNLTTSATTLASKLA